MDKKTQPTYMLSTRALHQNKRSTQAESEEMEKIFHANRHEKKAGVAILISDKIDFKTKAITRDKEGQYIVLKGAVQQQDITLVNIYAPNIGTPKHIRKILEDFKKDVDSNTFTLGDFNFPMDIMDRSSNLESTRILWH